MTDILRAKIVLAVIEALTDDDPIITIEVGERELRIIYG